MSRHEDRTRIRRGARPRPRVAKARGKARKRSTSSFSRAIAAIPPHYVAVARRAVGYALVTGALVVVVAGFVAMRLPQMIGIEAGELVGRAGFAVKRVEIRGIDRMDRAPVENAALDEKERAMPLVDLAMIRERLMAQGWVADARVSRRLPDTLVIDIVERQPAALWQYQHQLMLVDKGGRPIERVRLTGTPLPDLPIVIGPGANRQLGALEALLAAAPTLKPVLDGATWIGDRRWDIRFRSGETLSLPEGEAAARKALMYFAAQDGTARLLGQGITRFDMRVPGKLVLTMPKPADRTTPRPAMMPTSTAAPAHADPIKDI
jgi:cell division protein FtsQ